MDPSRRRRRRIPTEPPTRRYDPPAAPITRRFTAWVAAGALAMGLGAAMVTGAAAAAADTDSSGSESSSSSAASTDTRSGSATSTDTADSSTSLSDTTSTGAGGTGAGDNRSDDDTSGTDRTDTRTEDTGSDAATAALHRAELRAALTEQRDTALTAAFADTTADTLADTADDTTTTAESSAPPVTTGEPAAGEVIIDETEITTPEGQNGAPGAEESAATPRAGPSSGSPNTATQNAQPTPAAEPAIESNSLWDNIVRHLRFIFNNAAPTLENGKAEQVPGTGVVGTVVGHSNNGFDLTYRVAEQATYGTVTVDPVTGKYTYTAKPILQAPGTVDYFVIEADNGTAARLPGLAGLAQHVLHSLAVAFGLSRPSTTRLEILIEFGGTGQYGDPLGGREFYVHQNDDDCAVMAVASVWGQLTGTRPTATTEQEFLDLAKQTPSVSHPGMMWIDEGTNGLTTEDTAQLLRVKGLEVETYRMSEYTEGDANFRDGQDALGQLKEALVEGKGTIAMINANSMWSALGLGFDSTMVNANHALSVIGINLKVPNPNRPGDTYAVVYVNDSGLPEPVGQGMAVPLATFMWAWAASGYELITATNPNPVAQQLVWELAA
ncbi:MULTISPECIES: hypothetical protein [Mycobacteriaceae]|uniref:Peptidase C39-like domain-containing protein n=1 Tax=Mycolicibacterium neoaurum VKM Ac-1815D TaxID=700508 RepID=V5XIW3_MYCNE|nr:MULTISPECIES: hypothetical protein [Mycobacteriaceae]AHC28007.1 hypothetical protein D174_18035 [Mycolicibacterium neoaurum VKM Ac-1815D]AMO06701.1 hypothetical protein MyAD_17685 [Mycolicibacterium neoaurum]AXK74939.1 hypothetical protein DXK33_07260 [Mycolicibacterium neoaurum]KJQ48784.1 hypothetical protein TS71_19355 [Mycolicibacterium neoaurum]KUM07342.1 hypothetical protein AVZ31_16865 [Mycolicibacterium neoaurum]